MDDEKYFMLSHSEMKGNDGFYTVDIENCPNEVKLKQKQNLLTKFYSGVRWWGLKTLCGEGLETGWSKIRSIMYQKINPQMLNQ